MHSTTTRVVLILLDFRKDILLASRVLSTTRTGVLARVFISRVAQFRTVKCRHLNISTSLRLDVGVTGDSDNGRRRRHSSDIQCDRSGGLIKAMFPFRPRKPMYGGALKRQMQRSAAAAADDGTTSSRKGNKNRRIPDPLEPLRSGGPVERAVVGDLLALQRLFVARQKGTKDETAVVAAVPEEHDAPGSSFLLFKRAFREGKVGVLHTRCLPPRCDRADFAQLLYSACLGLLRRSLRDCEGGEKGDACEDDFGGVEAEIEGEDAGSDGLINAIFAVFCLYTLYETCPLPDFPSVVSSPTSDQAKEALSVLPLGLGGGAAGEQSRVIYRRAYRSPVRVGTGDVVHLDEVRDACMERAAACEARRARARKKRLGEADAAAGGAAAPASGPRARGWRCHCGLAEDCLEVLGRLRDGECLDYCEYAGPCSVEGFAGSTEYFEKVVEAPPALSAKADFFSMVGADAADVEVGPLGVASDDYEATLSRYISSVESLMQKSRQRHVLRRGAGATRAKLVQRELEPILQERRGDGSKPHFIERLNVIRELFEKGEYQSVVNLSYGTPEKAPELERVSSQEVILNLPGASIDEPQRNKNGAVYPPNFRFEVPRGLSASLEKGIRRALKDSINNALRTIAAKSAANKAKVPEEVRDHPCGPSTAGIRDGDGGSVQFLQLDEVESVTSQESRESRNGGEGMAALQDLLELARENDRLSEDSEGSSGDAGGSVVTDAPSSVGQAHLAALLQRVRTEEKLGDDGRKRSVSQRKRPSKKKKVTRGSKNGSGEETYDGNDSSSGGEGRSALASLLSFTDLKS